MKTYRINTNLGYYAFQEAEDEYDAMLRGMQQLIANGTLEAILVCEGVSMSYKINRVKMPKKKKWELKRAPINWIPEGKGQIVCDVGFESPIELDVEQIRSAAIIPTQVADPPPWSPIIDGPPPEKSKK